MIQEEKILYYAENIAKELIDMPSFSMENIASMLRSRIKLLIQDVLKDEVSDLEKQRSLMVEEYSSVAVPAWRKLELQPIIAKINVELKLMRKNADDVRISREYELLKKLCKDNLPKEFLDNFYELQKQVRL